jgi:hypothetical protein
MLTSCDVVAYVACLMKVNGDVWEKFKFELRWIMNALASRAAEASEFRGDYDSRDRPENVTSKSLSK